jgi:hypothetical protein|tara:strand:- start:372 stop:503 length:132 start_codon:yes stop_codon:yes gene_type:complete
VRQVKVTVEFIGSEEDGEEVLEILRLIADEIKAKREKESDDED